MPLLLILTVVHGRAIAVHNIDDEYTDAEGDVQDRQTRKGFREVDGIRDQSSFTQQGDSNIYGAHALLDQSLK